MSDSSRPATTSTRPGTGDSSLLPSPPMTRRRRPATETVEEEDEDWSEDEEDPGMFTYLPPASATDAKSSSLAPSSVPASPAALRSDADRPFVPSLLAPSLTPAARLTRSSSTTLSEQHMQSGSYTGLSPAAAYALAASETESQASLRSPSVLDGARRRGTFQYPESPTYQGDNPFTAESFKSESQKVVDEFARNRTPLVETELGFRPRAARWTGSTRPDTGRTDYTQETNELSYDDWDGSSISDSSSAGKDANYKMKQMGPSASSLGKDASLKERDAAFAGLNPQDFGGFGDDEEDSPYPEVRASVSNIDDVDMPCLTFRSWFLGLFFTLVVSAVNVFFTFRFPAPIVTPVIVQVLSYPFGKALARLLPATTFRVPKWMQRMGCEDEFSFNPGPFNIKEHTVIVIMANVATGPAFALNFSVASQKFYGIRQGLAFDFLLLLTTQLVGFGMAGICRKYLVWPAALIWPQNLVFCTLLNTLHAEDDDGSEGGVTRFRFFTYVMGGAFCWYFLPGSSSSLVLFRRADDFAQDSSSKHSRSSPSFAGWLLVSLVSFSFSTAIYFFVAENPVVNQLFGLSTGLGMSMLTFDWAQIAYIGSPLVVPWWAEVNIFFGFVVTFWIIAPALYYSDVSSLFHLLDLSAVADYQYCPDLVYFSFANVPRSSFRSIRRSLQHEPHNQSRNIPSQRHGLRGVLSHLSPCHFRCRLRIVFRSRFLRPRPHRPSPWTRHRQTVSTRTRTAKSRHSRQADARISRGAGLVVLDLSRALRWLIDRNSLCTSLAPAQLRTGTDGSRQVQEVQLPVWGLLLSLGISFLYILPSGFIFAMTSQQVWRSSFAPNGELIASTLADQCERNRSIRRRLLVPRSTSR